MSDFYITAVSFDVVYYGLFEQKTMLSEKHTTLQ